MITLDTVKQTVLEASRLMLNDTFDIAQKGGYANIVTSSDTAVQEFLCKKFSEMLPGSGFLCEENDGFDGLTTGIYDTAHEWTWIIDPIDGTANYARGIDQCAICVGLKHNDAMELGVVYLPRTGEMFHAVKGGGAFLNDRPIHVSKRPFEDAVMCTALSVYHKENTQICSEIINDVFLQANDVRRFGACAPEICYLAMGRVELYYEQILSPWDFAAASLILTEAGGVITDLDGNPLTCLVPAGAIGANTPENHARLLKIVKSHIK